jgi:hypothetical protein
VAFLVAVALVGLPASAAAGRLSPTPAAVVAAAGKTDAVGTESGSGRDAGGASASSALLVGGLVGALLLLSLALLPATATPRFARRRVDRLDIVLAGALALLAVTLVYLATVL